VSGARFLPVGKLDMELLRRLLGRIPVPADVLLGPGIGRDVAVVDAGGERYWLLKADPVTFASDEIGRYAVTVNVNDIAVSGGVPRWFLASVLLPEGATTPALVERIFAQIAAACARLGVAWVGGHTEVTAGLPRPLVAGALIGDVARDALVRSDGVRVGDRILCTKGVPLEGSLLLARERRDELLAAGVPAESVETCARYLDEPGICVLDDARAACAAARVHAMHDPTEGGLATALWELALASGVGLRVDAAAIPVLAPARALCARYGLDPLGTIASGALLVAVAAGDAAAVVRACAARGIPCVAIAEAVEASRGLVLVREGREEPLRRFEQDEVARVFGG
jgi:hydrogenase maturation factor